MNILQGTGASRGYANGTAVVKHQPTLKVPMHAIYSAEVEAERFTAARRHYDRKLQALEQQTAAELGEHSAEIFETYRSILYDDLFFNKVLERVRREGLNVECMIDDEARGIMRLLEALDDPYIRERAQDIKNVCNELIRIMMGISSDAPLPPAVEQDWILVADDLTPAETVRMDKARLRAIVTAKGGQTSHTVILAKALGIPVVVGVTEALTQIKTGMPLLVDAGRGEVILEPDDAFRAAFYRSMELQLQRRALYASMAAQPAVTKDGHPVAVTINTGDAGSLSSFTPEQNDGVGLYRTELLYMESLSMPKEDYQYKMYRSLVTRAKGKPVTIRTLDIGGDKQLPYLPLPREDNPALGCRAIRLSFAHQNLFLTQIRAILRAAAHGNVSILFPMIITLEELLAARDFLQTARDQLRQEGVPHGDCQIGIMIETPAAVRISDILARHCDFFSIGTNDLIQYTAAVDRMNRRVQYAYDHCNLSVLRSIAEVSRTAAAAGIPWRICGEAASDELLLPLWVALGVHELSVTPSEVGLVKYWVNALNRRTLQQLVEPLWHCATIAEARKHLAQILHHVQLDAEG